MTELPDDNSSDRDGRLPVGLPCIGCGYNLRHQLIDGVCSECGRPVRDSVDAKHLWFADGRFLRMAAVGMALFAGTAGMMLLTFVLVAIGVVAAPPVAVLLPCCGLLVLWPLSLAVLSFAPSPHLRIDRRFGWGRRPNQTPVEDVVAGVWMSAFGALGLVVMAICAGAGSQSSAAFVMIVGVVGFVLIVAHLFFTFALTGGLVALLESTWLDRLWQVARALFGVLALLSLAMIVTAASRRYVDWVGALMIPWSAVSVAGLLAVVVAGFGSARRFWQRWKTLKAMRAG